MTEIIEIAGRGDKKIDAVCTLRIGTMAVTRANDVPYWTITDIPTGAGVPFRFDDLDLAEMAAIEVAATVDWAAFVRGVIAGTPDMAKMRAVVDILKDFGGERTDGPSEADKRVLASRLEPTDNHNSPKPSESEAS